VKVNVDSGDPYQCAGYRLPTEAEWEYAYRAGTTTAFYNGAITQTGTSPLDPNLDAIGWYRGNSGNTTHPDAQKAPNAWKLNDMSGNVWEWCWDWLGASPASAVTDPLGPASGTSKTLRGGSYGNEASWARAATRAFAYRPDHADPTLGFRLARTAP
jgi:formylglycine-generating enzyme required for sulfatase activity